MTITRAAAARASGAAPGTVRRSIGLWLTAIAAGAAEALVHLLLPEPPTVAQLGVRFGIYAVLTALVLALHTGRNAVRWAVALVLGVFGTASLVLAPVSWLLAGGSAVDFLVTAEAPVLVVTALRALHIAAVLAALVLLFHPAANRFFARR